MKTPGFITRMALWQVDLLGTGVVCAIAAVWYLGGVRPLSQARAERDSMETELTTQRSIAQDKAKLAAIQEKSLKKVQAEIASSSIQLLPADQVNSRVSALAGVAGKAGLRVDEIKPSAPVPLARFTTVPIRLSGAGEYKSISLFFDALRGEFRDTGLTAFKLQVSETAEGSELRFELNLVWYAAPMQATPKK